MKDRFKFSFISTLIVAVAGSAFFYSEASFACASSKPTGKPTRGAGRLDCSALPSGLNIDEDIVAQLVDNSQILSDLTPPSLLETGCASDEVELVSREKNMVRDFLGTTRGIRASESSLYKNYSEISKSKVIRRTADVKNVLEMMSFLKKFLGKKGSVADGPVCLNEDIYQGLVESYLELSQKSAGYTPYDAYQLYYLIHSHKADWLKELKLKELKMEELKRSGKASLIKEVRIPKKDVGIGNRSLSNFSNSYVDNVFQVTVSASGDVFISGMEKSFQIKEDRSPSPAQRPTVKITNEISGREKARKLGEGGYKIAKTEVHIPPSVILNERSSRSRRLALSKKSLSEPVQVSATAEPFRSTSHLPNKKKAYNQEIKSIQTFNQVSVEKSDALANLRVVPIGTHREKVVSDVYEGSFSDAFNNQKLVSEPQKYEVYFQLADALKTIHDRGWVHNDIKPENAVLTGFGHSLSGKARWIDLGLSFNYEQFKSDPNRWAAIGTLGYMPPESTLPLPKFKTEKEQMQWLKKRDIFSFGMMLYLTLCEPGEAENVLNFFDVNIRNPFALKAQIWNLKTKLINTRNPFKKLIAEMISYDPKERPDINKVRSTLDGFRKASRIRNLN